MKINIRNLIFSFLALTGTCSTILAQEYFGSDNACNSCFADIGRFSVGADWLYWKATEDGLNYGHLTTRSPAIATTATQNQVLKPKFKYDSGYRVYLNYELPCYDWELGIIYTHAPNTRARSTALAVSTTVPSVSQIIIIEPTSLLNFGNVLTAVTGDAVKTQWGLDFDYVDFDLANTLCLSDYLRVKPHLGVRYLWGKQDLNINLVGTIDILGIIEGANYLGKVENRTHGVGVEGGLWGDWNVGCGLSIIGHLGGAILYGKHRIEGNQVLSRATSPDTTVESTFGYSDVEHTSIPMLDYFIGVQYATCICEFEVNFHIGWEQHVAFDMNRFTTTDGGDLSLQGLTLGGGFAF